MKGIDKEFDQVWRWLIIILIFYFYRFYSNSFYNVIILSFYRLTLVFEVRFWDDIRIDHLVKNSWKFLPHSLLSFWALLQLFCCGKLHNIYGSINFKQPSESLLHICLSIYKGYKGVLFERITSELGIPLDFFEYHEDQNIKLLEELFNWI